MPASVAVPRLVTSSAPPGTFLDNAGFEPRDDVEGAVARAVLYAQFLFVRTDPEDLWAPASTAPGRLAAMQFVHTRGSPCRS